MDKPHVDSFEHRGDAACKKAQAELASGQYEQALASAQSAHASNPNHPVYLAVLGHIYFATGEFLNALIHLGQGHLRGNDDLDVLIHAAIACEKTHQFLRAANGLDVCDPIYFLCRALNLYPGERAKILQIFSCVEVCAASLAKLTENQRVLIDLIDHSGSTIGLVSSLQQVERQAVLCPDPIASSLDDLIGHCNKRPLLVRGMRFHLVTHEGDAQLLTILRKRLLKQRILMGSRSEPAGSIELMACLALQCHLNEYVFFESDDETAQIDKLESDIAAVLEAGLCPNPCDLLLYACYRCLDTLGADSILTHQAELVAISPVLDRHIREARIERDLRLALPSLTAIDQTSELVRDQYEADPYPRWVHLGYEIGQMLLHQNDPRIDPARFGLHGYIRAISADRIALAPDSSRRLRILIAGCGTGQQPLSRYGLMSNCEVIAIDLSKASLAYAKRMADARNIRHIQFLHGDILNLGESHGKFDIIESAGVLHHMADPMAGFAQLRARLAPGGLIYIGLYSLIARQALLAAAAQLRDGAADFSKAGLHRLRAKILGLDAHDPNRQTILRMMDFYSGGMCRDLLMHEREVQFTADQIANALDQFDLKLVAFDTNGEIWHGLQKHAPDLAYGAPPQRWFEAIKRLEAARPTAFLGMYKFWAQAN